jgi:hypothetical protein
MRITVGTIVGLLASGRSGEDIMATTHISKRPTSTPLSPGQLGKPK